MEWLWELDQAIQQAINVGLHSPTMTSFFRYVTYLGLDHVALPIVGVMIVAAGTRRCGIHCFASYAAAAISAFAIKYMTPRFRPGYPGEGVLVAPDEQVFLSSFPSGHTAVAFGIAFAVCLSWPGNRRLAGTIAVVAALLVGVSRVYRGIHWPTDIVGSILVSWLAAHLTYLLLNRGRAEASPRPSEEPA